MPVINYTVITKLAGNKFTIVNTHTSANYDISIANINGDIIQTWNVNGYLNITVEFTIDGIYILTATNTTIIATQFYLWSTCNLFKCMEHLVKRIFCCRRGKCEEHTSMRQIERNELNRMLLLYNQFSMMSDGGPTGPAPSERYDYLPLTENTDLFNDIFNKLNIITRRCGKCCKEKDKRGKGPWQDRFAREGAYDKDLIDNLPIDLREEEPCENCEEQYMKHDEECREEAKECITLTDNIGDITPVQ